MRLSHEAISATAPRAIRRRDRVDASGSELAVGVCFGDRMRAGQRRDGGINNTTGPSLGMTVHVTSFLHVIVPRTRPSSPPSLCGVASCMWLYPRKAEAEVRGTCLEWIEAAGHILSHPTQDHGKHIRETDRHHWRNWKSRIFCRQNVSCRGGLISNG